MHNGTFGDNDTLSADVAVLANADLLVILSDVDGLYDANPRENPDAERISYVDKVTPEMLDFTAGKGSWLGTGNKDHSHEQGYGERHHGRHRRRLRCPDLREDHRPG